MPSQATRDQRRAATVAGTGTALGVSLIGGALVLMLAGPPVQKPAALEPLSPPPPTSTAPAPEPDLGAGGDLLSMFGGDAGASINAAGTTVDTDGPSVAGDLLSTPTGFAPGELPPLSGVQLPPSAALPAGTPVDWGSIFAPLAQAQNNAQAANVAGAVVGSAAGLTGAAINSTAVVLGDLILYGALNSNGQGVLNGLQTMLASVPAMDATATGLQGLQAMSPDLSGLNAAFAAAAAAPPLGVPQLPPMPPGLPAPEQALAALGTIGAVPLPPPPELPPMPDLSGLFALPAIGIPQLPGPPQLPQGPKPEDVVGGVVGGLVAATIAGAVLGAIFQPPSLTRLMGLPF